MSSETGRIEAFSDGVFAIAITLLILDLKVPSVPAGGLGPALLAEWPGYAAFLVSFAFIGIMWVNHHRLFTHIGRANNALLIFNLLLLLGVCVIPFSTAVLAAYLNRADARAAALLYNGVYFVIAIFFNLLWNYAVRRQLLHDATAPTAAKITGQYAFGPLLYAICLALGLLSVPASLILNFLLAVFFALPPHIAARGRRAG